MSTFAWGFLAGGLAALGVGAAVGYRLYQRLVALQQREHENERLAELVLLTGGLAHEIKNPLSTVQLNLQLLKEDLEPGNPTHARLVHRLDTVYGETTRLREILDDFLRYAGKFELDRRPTELNGLLEELVDFFGPQAQLQRAQLRLKRSDAPLVANIDPRLIKQAVLNLMLNGIQAIAGQGGGDLILSVSRAEGFAVIDVIDTGPGIPPDVLAKIFTAYYTTKRGGTGLGLAMARRIIEAHGGALSVTSDPGKGSDFRIELPV